MTEGAPRPAGAELSMPPQVERAIKDLPHIREITDHRLSPLEIATVEATLTSLVKPEGPDHLLADPDAPNRDVRLEQHAESEHEVLDFLGHAAAVRGYKLVPIEEQGQ